MGSTSTLAQRNMMNYDSHSSISLAAVGDLMLGDSPKCVGVGVRSSVERRGAAFIFNGIREHLQGDIVFGNLECVLCDDGYDRKSMRNGQMRGVPGCAADLKEAGFTVVNVANNHTMQFGAGAFEETCRRIREAGVGLVGVRGSGSFTSVPYVQTIRGRNVGILGYSTVRDDYCRRGVLYAEGNLHEMCSDVRKLKESCDHVVVSLHWGDEFIATPSTEAVELASAISEAGAALILGHHAHVVQEMETVNETLVLYGLGNFVSDMAWDRRLQRGVLAKIRLQERGAAAIEAVIPTVSARDNSVMVADWPLSLKALGRRSMNDTLESEYRARVEVLRKRNRNLSHLYMLRKMFHYHPAVFLEMIGKSASSFFGSFSSLERTSMGSDT